MRTLHLSVRFPEAWRHPMHRFLEESDAVWTDRLLHWNLAQDGVDVALFYIEADRDVYVDRLEAVESVVDYDVTPIDEDSFYVYVHERTRPPERRFRAAFQETGLVVLPPVEYLPDGTMELTLAGPGEDLRAMLDDLPEEVEASVEWVGTGEAGPASTLTDRQREALAAGLAVGYYEVPREGSLDDVAAELDCAPATASTHLRKAEAGLVRAVLGDGT